LVGQGHDALVIEHHHTYTSFADLLPEDGSVGTLIYGAGAHFKASVTYVVDLPRSPVGGTPRRRSAPSPAPTA
jgi:hypothetical protein